MSLVLAIGYVFSTLATALAWLVTGRHREHRAVALLLSVGLVSDITRRTLRALILAPAHASVGAGPLVGWGRVAGHIDSALFLAWPAGLAAVFVALYLKRRPWLVALAYVATIAALVLTYPTTRGDVLRKVFLAIELTMAATSLGILIPFVRSRRWPGHSHGVALLLLCTEVAMLFGPWRGELVAGWTAGQTMYTVTYVVLSIMQWRVLWGHLKSS